MQKVKLQIIGLTTALVFITVSAVSCDKSPSTTAEKDGGENEPISLDEAARLVLTEFVKPENLDHEVIVFSWPDPLKPGDLLTPYLGPDLVSPGKALTFNEATWFFWVDDFPGAQFAHPTRFILVDQATGEGSTFEEVWWPVLNGKSLWTDTMVYWDEVNWVFSNVEWRPSSLDGFVYLPDLIFFPELEDEGTNAGLVVNGWGLDQTLKEDSKYNADGMTGALDGAGFDTDTLGPDEYFNPETIREWIADQSLVLGEGDTALIYITGHGGHVDGQGRISVGGYTLYEEDLAYWLGMFDPSVEIFVILDACYSGSFIDSLSEVADVTITSTDQDHESAGDFDPNFDENFAVKGPYADGSTDNWNDPNPGDNGTEFSSGLIEDWNEILGDPAKKEQVRVSAAHNNESFKKALLYESFLSALEKDVTFLRGYTFPQFVSSTDVSTEAVDLSGVYYLGPIIVIFDPDGHVVFVGLPDDLLVDIFFGSITIEGPAPWVNVSGDWNPEDGAFFAEGRGVVAGYSNIAVTFEGTLTAEGITGDYTMGAKGGLPGGQPIVYSIEGYKVEETTEEPTPTATEEPTPLVTEEPTPQTTDGNLAKAEVFAQAFNDAFQSGDTEALFELLHPAVIDLYGAEACQAYFASVIENPTQIEVLEILEVGSWDWVIDEQSTLIELTFKVTVNFTVQGQTSQQEIHLSLTEDGSFRWFTDCGEPLP